MGERAQEGRERGPGAVPLQGGEGGRDGLFESRPEVWRGPTVGPARAEGGLCPGGREAGHSGAGSWWIIRLERVQ